MARKAETIEDIVADIRAQNQGLSEDGYALSPYVHDLLRLADRIEAAHKREADSIHRAMVVLAGIEMEDSTNPPRLWTALEDAYDALSDALGMDGETTADVEEAVATGRHFVVRMLGNNAKMREVVAETEKCIDKCISILTEIPDSCGYGGLLEDAADELCELKEQFIKPALSAPPRNCDKCLTPKDAMLAHLAEVYEGEKVEFGDYEWCEFVKWIFAEAKGTNKMLNKDLYPSKRRQLMAFEKHCRKTDCAKCPYIPRTKPSWLGMIGCFANWQYAEAKGEAK